MTFEEWLIQAEIRPLGDGASWLLVREAFDAGKLAASTGGDVLAIPCRQHEASKGVPCAFTVSVADEDHYVCLARVRASQKAPAQVAGEEKPGS